MENYDELVASFTNWMRQKRKQESTVKTYQQEIGRFLFWITASGGDVQHLTRFDVQTYLNRLEQERKSAATISKVLASITAVAKFLNCPGIVEEISVPRVHQQLQIAPKSLDRAEQSKLLRKVEQSQNQRNIAITYLLLMTGIRVSELTALNREDVQLGERSGSLVVRNGKGNVQRELPLAREARHYLKKYLELRQDQEPALFLSNFKKRLSVRTVQHMLEKFQVNPHRLRHTFCRQLVQAGVDIAAVADLAGHLDLNVTRRYAKPSAKELQEAIERVYS